jgi:hypothetical protein
MRAKIFAALVVVCAIAGLIMAMIFINPFSRSGLSNTTSTSNSIFRENAKPGTTEWQIPQGRGATIQIQAYASATSVLPGQKITFYVSTLVEGTGYSIDVYRLGWYGGLGGRLVVEVVGQRAHAQGYYNPFTHSLVHCTSCLVDERTGLVEAGWRPSYLLTVPSDWTTGVYLAKFIDARGKQTYVPFDVRGNAQSFYVAVTSDTTYAAYNDWGGYSLYKAYNKVHGLARGVKVSFDRPYNIVQGSGYVLTFEADAIRWLEKQGYDLSYISSVDLHENSAQILSHGAYISLGHDEYWSKEMRDGVEHARDRGIGLAFLGANAAYWQIRFESDSTGVSDRIIVCYKVATAKHDLDRDPYYGVDNTRVTAEWRDPVINRPENALVGVMFSGYSENPPGFPWRLSSQVHTTLLNNTGLQAGQQYGCQLVGYEWDRVYDNGKSPVGLEVLSASPTRDHLKVPDISNTTYYIAPSGAFVFATGSIYWTQALDSYRYTTIKPCLGQNQVVPGIQKLMTNVMEALVGHAFQQRLAKGVANNLFSKILLSATTSPDYPELLMSSSKNQRYILFVAFLSCPERRKMLA